MMLEKLRKANCIITSGLGLPGHYFSEVCGGVNQIINHSASPQIGHCLSEQTGKIAAHSVNTCKSVLRIRQFSRHWINQCMHIESEQMCTHKVSPKIFVAILLLLSKRCDDHDAIHSKCSLRADTSLKKKSCEIYPLKDCEEVLGH